MVSMEIKVSQMIHLGIYLGFHDQLVSILESLQKDMCQRDINVLMYFYSTWNYRWRMIIAFVKSLQ